MSEFESVEEELMFMADLSDSQDDSENSMMFMRYLGRVRTLAAQRDEGLAREAELRAAFEDSQSQLVERGKLLAEAEKLARSLLDEYDEAKQNARQYRPGAVIGLALRFLASPSRADGEQPS
jgi:hypothetical protein